MAFQAVETAPHGAIDIDDITFYDARRLSTGRNKDLLLAVPARIELERRRKGKRRKPYASIFSEGPLFQRLAIDDEIIGLGYVCRLAVRSYDFIVNILIFSEIFDSIAG